MSLDSFISECKFYDAANFPHGFARSGDFTKGEAELLTNSGYTIKQITQNGVAASNADQEQLVRVVNGEQPASTAVEKVWIKYMTVVQKRRSHKICTLTGRGNDFGGDEGFTEQAAS